MAVSGEIAASAHGELPETWRALESDPNYGDDFLERKINSQMASVFGIPLSEEEQDGLDVRVVDYVGKLVALQLINPGIDYWSKQKTLQSAGERENSGWADRSQALKDLRKYLLEETRTMYPEISDLIPDRRRTRTAVPVVTDIEVAHTPSPFDFEPAFAPVEETT